MAINIKELRVGNWLLKDDNPKLLLMAGFLDVYHFPSHFKPIELTPKLLENFWFERKSFNDHLIAYLFYPDIKDNKYIFCIYPSDITNDNFEFRITVDNIYFREIISIKYLHQLQNIFYSLTGIELNDIVAYNYYKSKIDVKDGNYPISFNEYLKEKENDKWTFDFPQNLFL